MPLKERFLIYHWDESESETCETIDEAKKKLTSMLMDGDDMFGTETLHWSVIVDLEDNTVYRPFWKERDNKDFHQCPYQEGRLCEGEDVDCPEGPKIDEEGTCPDCNPWEWGDYESEGSVEFKKYDSSETDARVVSLERELRMICEFIEAGSITAANVSASKSMQRFRKL